MPELYLYNNPNIEYVPRLSAQVVDKTLTTMEQNHLKTLELQGELEAAVNAMDLDESENEYKAGLVNDIKKAVDDSTVDGYAGYALSDIVKKYGDIKGNPILKGKVQANAAHKANDKLLDELAMKGTISSDTAAYFKAKNPYYNHIKYDKNGNAVGTDTWKASINPVEDIDLNKLFAAAKQYISPKINSWNNVKFVHADGRVDNKFSDDVKFLQHSNGSTEVITKKQIRDAVDAAINANGVYRQGLEQLYKVQVWKGENNDYQENELKNGAIPALDEYGKPVGFNTFLDKLIIPFQDALVKNNSSSNVSYTPYTGGGSSRSKKDSGSGSGSGNMVEKIFNLADPNTIETAPFAIDAWNNTLNLTHEAVDKGREWLNLFQNVGLGRTDLKMDEYTTLPTPANLKVALANRDATNKLSKQQIDEYTKFYKSVEDSALSFDSTKRDESDPKRRKEYALRAADMISYGQLDSSFANSNNEVYKRASDIHNDVITRLYGNSDSFGFKPKDNVQKELILGKLKGRAGVREDNGIIYLDRDGQDNIETFVSIINDNKITGDYYRKKEDGTDDRISSRRRIDLPRWFETLSGASNKTAGYGRTSIELADNVGVPLRANFGPSEASDLQYPLRSHFSPSQIADIANEPYKYLSSVARDTDIQSVANPERTLTTGRATLRGGTPSEVYGNELRSDINSDSNQRAVGKEIADDAKEELVEAAIGSGAANFPMWVKTLDENGNAVYTPLYDQKEKEEILLDLRNMYNSNRLNAIKGYFTDVPGVTNTGSQLIWTGTRLQPDPNDGNRQKSQPIVREIFIEGNITGDPEIQAMINSSARKASNEVYTTTIFNNRPTTISSYDGYNANLTYLGHSEDGDLLQINTSNNTHYTITKQQADAYRQLYNTTIDKIGGVADQLINGLHQASPGEDEELYQLSAANQIGTMIIADILADGDLKNLREILSFIEPSVDIKADEKAYAKYALDPDNYIVDRLNVPLTYYVTNNIFR